MKTLNQVTLMGNVGNPPELNRTKSGIPVAHFSLATDRWPDQNGVINTDWHRVTVWRKRAEAVATHVVSGQRLVVVGSLRQSRWVDPETGAKRSSTEIVARDVVFCEKPMNRESEVPTP